MSDFLLFYGAQNRALENDLIGGRAEAVDFDGEVPAAVVGADIDEEALNNYGRLLVVCIAGTAFLAVILSLNFLHSAFGVVPTAVLFDKDPSVGAINCPMRL